MWSDQPALAETPRRGSPEQKTLRILVAVPTCNRPDDLSALLDSLDRVEQPDAATCSVLVVENGRRLPAAPVVADRRLFGHPVTLVTEPEPGIPFARNAALDFALEGGFDLLAFVDDDEIVDSGWLKELVVPFREHDADLAAGPVYAAPPRGAMTALQRYLMQGYEAWYEKRQRRNRERDERGHHIVTLTNNWMFDLDFARRTGIRFAEELRYSGGSDARFDSDLRALGGTTAWCPRAKVYETIVPERLNLRYILFRGSQQSISHVERSRKSGWRRRLVPIVFFGPILFYGLGCIVSAPVAGPYAFFYGLRCCGRAFGSMMGIFGARSGLYKIGT